jgi:uncharacterized protein
VTLHHLGARPEWLARFYPDANGAAAKVGADAKIATDANGAAGAGPGISDPTGRTVQIFVKLPVAGAVKTRLAAALGTERAAALYAELGRGIVEGLSGSPRWRTEVHVAEVHAADGHAADGHAAEGHAAEGARPPALDAVSRWLPFPGLRFVPQTGKDLGERMLHALTSADPASAVCLIGSDAPAIDAAYMEGAFAALESGVWDVVLAPAEDGGYALVGVASEPRAGGGGVRARLSALFQDIPWSTDQVFRLTRARAESEGLRVHALPTVRDIDTLEDLKAEAPELAQRYLPA